MLRGSSSSHRNDNGALPANVSAIIPCFNNEDVLARTLQSIESQSLQVREVIVVDDCSRNFQATENVIAQFNERLSIRVIRNERNRGASAARNAGVAAATSKYIAFLDADDVWLPDKIRLQYEFMESAGAVISGHFYAPEMDSVDMSLITLTPPVSPVTQWHFCAGNLFATPTVMALRASFVKFDPGLMRCEDHSCWIDNLAQNGNAWLIQVPLAAGFKPLLGHAGLSGSVRLMHKGRVDGLLKLRAAGTISVAFFLLSMLIEYIKFPLRAGRIQTRKMLARADTA